MAAPGIITGSNTGLSIFRSTALFSQPESSIGVFGEHPGATPKYAQNAPSRGRDAESRDTMSRLFIQAPKGAAYRDFLASLPPKSRPLARVLASGGPSGGGGGTGFFDFLMTQANEPMQEKAQITDTLTDNYVAYYSGQVPLLWSYSGTLLNTYQDDQRVWMLRMYRDILRGTRLATRQLTARLRYDSFLLTGYMESLVLGLDGNTDHNASTFQFTFRVKRLSIITSTLGSPTVAETPATTKTVLEGGASNEDENERIGTVTPEDPPEAAAQPATENPPLTDVEQQAVRTDLREAGLTDAQIDVQIAASEAVGQSLSVDGRETEFQTVFEGTSRVAEQTEGPLFSQDPSLANPDNVTNDGLGGASNVRSQSISFEGAMLDPSADVSSIGLQSTPLQERSSQRRRGGNPR